MKSSPSTAGSSPESRKMKGNASTDPAADHAKITGVVTRSTARRLSIQLSSKLASPSKKTPTKSRLSSLKESKLTPPKDTNKQREKSKSSPTMNNDNNEQSIEIRKSEKRNVLQKSPVSKDSHKVSCVAESPKFVTSISNRNSEIIPLNAPRAQLADATTSQNKVKEKIIVPEPVIPTVKVEVAENCLNNDVNEEASIIQLPILQPVQNKSTSSSVVEVEETECVKQCSEKKLNKPSAVVVIDHSEVMPKIIYKEKPSSPAKKPVTPKKVVIEDKSDTDDDSDAESRKEIMRSAEKRIIRNISTSESESRHVGLKQIKLNFVRESTGSDSDSAPEDVTFDASKKSAFDVRKRADESIKRDKQRKKEKRKERLEMIRQRKEENLIRLKERKANLEDASCSSSEESVHDLNALSIDRFKGVGKKTYIFDEVEEKKQKSDKVSKSGVKRLPSELLENLPDQPPKKLKMSHSLTATRVPQVKEKIEISRLPTSKTKRDIDFIPVSSSGSTQFGVVPLNKPQLKTVSQQAADFRNNMLYGNRVNRVPATTLIKNRQKLKVYK